MATKKKRMSEDRPDSLEYEPFYGLELDNEQKAFRDAIWNRDKLIVFCNARAGCGKTTISVGVASLLCHYKDYDGIVYIMSPTQEMTQGYLPGSISQKSQPYMEALYEAAVACNLNPFTAIETPDDMTNIKDGSAFIQCYTDTFMRGINIDNKVVILDECQNYYGDNLKKVLTRIKDTCKTICIGHSGQIDLVKHPERSGFEKYIEHFRGDERSAVCELTTNYRGWVSQHADDLIL